MNKRITTLGISVFVILAVGACNIIPTSQTNVKLVNTPVVTTVTSTVNQPTAEAVTKPHTVVPLPLPTITIVVQITATIDVHDGATRWIGLEYPPLPPEIKSGFGAIIWGEPEMEYSISSAVHDNLRMMWLSKSTKIPGQRRASWIVVAVLVIPPLSGENEVLVTSGCFLDGELDPEIMVVANLDQDAYLTRFLDNSKIIRAWRANRTIEKFEELSTRGIECNADDAMRWR